MPKVCLKCNNEFPPSVVIDGQRKTLCNRKYCLDCSPWGMHNTKPLHGESTTQKVRYVNKPGTKEYASEKYHANKEKHNQACVLRQRRLKQERKLALVERLGGCCSECRYDKCLWALEFHHVDPTTKSFLINGTRLANKRMDELVQEVDKCILLCANCHRERHFAERMEIWSEQE